MEWIPLLENGLIREMRLSSRLGFPKIEADRVNTLSDESIWFPGISSSTGRDVVDPWKPIPFWHGTSTFLFPWRRRAGKKSKGPSAWPQLCWTLEEDWRRGKREKGSTTLSKSKKNADYPNGCPARGIVRSFSAFREATSSFSWV